MIRHAVAVGLGAAALCALAGEADDLRELRARLERVRAEAAATESRKSEAEEALRQAEQAISEANRTLAELAASKREAQDGLDRAAAELADTQARIDGRQQDLGRVLYARYIAGESSSLKLLLSAQDAHRLQRELVYYRYLSLSHLELIERLRSDLARLADAQRRGKEKAAELAAIEQDSVRERQALIARQAERRKALEAIGIDLREQRRTVESLERDERRLSKLVDDLARTLRRAETPPPAASSSARNEAVPDAGLSGAFAKLKGKLRLPVRGELAGRSGTQRSDGSAAGKGVFIAARSGEEVRAVATGRVVFADWMRGFGNLLILDHGDGYMTIYGNNEAVLKRLGDAVHAGDVVATVGASGGAETSGLYFEIRHQGRAFDPLPWVSLK